jgi:hypothetical protein
VANGACMASSLASVTGPPLPCARLRGIAGRQHSRREVAAISSRSACQSPTICINPINADCVPRRCRARAGRLWLNALSAGHDL